MGSLNSFFTSPSAFIKGLANRKNTPSNTYVIGFSTWKQYLRKYFPERNLYFIDKNISKHEFESVWKKQITSQSSAEIFIWGFKAPNFIFDFAKKHGKKILHVEDGFIRSVDLGAQKTPPMSLTLDSRTPYFDARKPSDLEVLLNEYDFKSDPELMARAKSALDKMLKGNISKYNNAPKCNIESIYGKKTKKRVLVIGQVEDDASILLGCTNKISNNDLVKLAAKENPAAQIIYKPHPDVLAGNRADKNDISEIEGICTVVRSNISLPQSFHEVDHVYTLTSLGGFEALLRKIKVTTIGCPFYSGWGLTDDRQPNSRRTRKLSVDELFAASYILYPKYFNPAEGTVSDIESVISNISKEMSLLPSNEPNKPAKNVTTAKKTPSAPTPHIKVSQPANPQSSVARSTESKADIPEWFNPRPGPELKAALTSSKPLFLYVPWIAGHGDALIEKISESESYNFAPLDFVKNIDGNGVRPSVLRYTRSNPGLYRKMLINRLVPLRGKIKGIVFTFDWSPAMRIIAGVCEELHIPRILIPHESVFVDRDKYYWDETSKASMPCADLILGWGEMQKSIFTERGYPAHLFHSTGAPKFDTHSNYSPSLTREQFCRLFGLDPTKKTILFASQPLDSQLDKKAAQLSQRKAIDDLAIKAELKGLQLLVRLPPNKEDILGPATRLRITNADHVAIDEGHCYLVSPEEAIYHSDIVTSINSTMLFEGMLMGRPALSIKYVDFDQIWEKADIPAAKNPAEIALYLSKLIENNFPKPGSGMQWAANMFGIGHFDGQASSRIKQKLKSIATGTDVPLRAGALERLFNKEPLDVIAIPSSAETLSTTQLYFQKMLQARTCISSSARETELKHLASVEIFFQWGITESNNKRKQREIATELGRPLVYVEDGFIRSLDIGLSKEPGLSIILDDTTAYYDATNISRLSRLLESDNKLSQSQINRSRSAIDLITSQRVSKYNHAPDLPLKIGTPGKKKILLVDQRYGDQSVASGLGSEAAFDKMLQDAIFEHPDHDILIKQHPDAIKGGKSSYFSNEKLTFTKYMDNVFPILFDVNPFSLFDIVDEVYVVTSGMGFEALMAGKTVHCYGMPFYAGWGCTVDQQTLPSRTKRRSVEELFHFAYIESSRYFSPKDNTPIEVEELVKYIAKLKNNKK